MSEKISGRLCVNLTNLEPVHGRAKYETTRDYSDRCTSIKIYDESCAILSSGKVVY